MNASARDPVHKESSRLAFRHSCSHDGLFERHCGRERERGGMRERQTGGERGRGGERERELFLGYFCSRIKNLLSTLFCYMPNSLCINVE